MVIPCIIVASLVGAIVVVLGTLPIAHGEPLSANNKVIENICSFLSIIRDCGIFSLPVFITWATVKHFKGNEVLGLLLGITLVPANIMSGLQLANIDDASLIKYWDFGIFKVLQCGFQAQILAAILAGLALLGFERLFKRIIPKTIEVIFVPMLSILLSFTSTYLLIAPVARAVDKAILKIFVFLVLTPSLRVVGSTLLGVIHVPLMFLGLHLAFLPINITLIASGLRNPFWPLTVSTVLSCGGAALGTFFAVRVGKLKDSARESIVTTLILGTVEPALFNVCAKHKPAMIAAITASTVGGCMCGLFDLAATTQGVNGVLSFLNIPFEDWGFYLITLSTCIILSCVFAFTLTRKQKAVEK